MIGWTIRSNLGTHWDFGHDRWVVLDLWTLSDVLYDTRAVAEAELQDNCLHGRGGFDAAEVRRVTISITPEKEGR